MTPAQVFAWIILIFIASPLVAYLAYWFYKRAKRAPKEGEGETDIEA